MVLRETGRDGFHPCAEGGRGVREAGMEGMTRSKHDIYNRISKGQRKASSEDGPPWSLGRGGSRGHQWQRRGKEGQRGEVTGENSLGQRLSRLQQKHQEA